MNIIAFITGVLLGTVTLGIPLGYYLKYLWDEECEDEMLREEATKVIEDLREKYRGCYTDDGLISIPIEDADTFSEAMEVLEAHERR